jgi:D-alanyl-D-alanine carboxypeptidase
MNALLRLQAYALVGLIAIALAVGWSSRSLPAMAEGEVKLVVDPVALESTLKNMASEMLVPGALMLLRTPEGETIIAYGRRGLDDPTPVTADDHIRIGSNTKTWTGTVILQMVEEGKLALDDPVSKYRPNVPNGENITIEMLLNMRSGLFNYSTTYKVNHILDTEPLRGWNQDELLAIAFELPPYFEPNQGYRYSNTNTVLLGMIAEQIDGKQLETIFQDRIFAPLGLTDSLLPAISSNAIPDPHPRGYMYTDNVITLATNAIPPDLQYHAKIGTLKPNDQTDVNPSWGRAAGSGISTARDLATYAEALTTGKLLGQEMQKIRLDSVRPTNPDDPQSARYGLGIAKMGPMYGHTGELPGFNSFMGSDPVNKVTLIVWTNLAPAADGRDPATTIARALLGQIYATPQ